MTEVKRYKYDVEDINYRGQTREERECDDRRRVLLANIPNFASLYPISRLPYTTLSTEAKINSYLCKMMYDCYLNEGFYRSRKNYHCSENELDVIKKEWCISIGRMEYIFEIEPRMKLTKRIIWDSSTITFYSTPKITK